MKRILSIIIFITIIITAVLFFVNFKVKNMEFFYKLGFTIIFEILFILCFGISADYKDMNMAIKLIYFFGTFLFLGLEVYILFFAKYLFQIKIMSRTMTTTLLVISGVQILTLFILFAIGNVFSNRKA